MVGNLSCLAEKGHRMSITEVPAEPFSPVRGCTLLAQVSRASGPGSLYTVNNICIWIYIYINIYKSIFMTNSQTSSNSKQFILPFNLCFGRQILRLTPIHKAHLQPRDVENNAPGWPAPCTTSKHKMEHAGVLGQNCLKDSENDTVNCIHFDLFKYPVSSFSLERFLYIQIMPSKALELPTSIWSVDHGSMVNRLIHWSIVYHSCWLQLARKSKMAIRNLSSFQVWKKCESNWHYLWNSLNFNGPSGMKTFLPLARRNPDWM